MGLLSQSLLHAVTDKLAALVQQDLDGIIGERGAAANVPLADAIDAGGDHDLEVALLAKALAVDRGALPANLKTALTNIVGQTRFSDLAAAITAYVTGSAGGGYASLAAYLDAVAGKVHPLAAEIWRLTAGSDPFLLNGAVVGPFCPNYQAAVAKRVYTGADGSLDDDTDDAGDTADTEDVPLFVSDGDCLYVGYDSPFAMLIPALSTKASDDVGLSARYWNGSAWAPLAITDHSEGFTRSGPISWTNPSDWCECALDGDGNPFADQTPRYYIRLQRTADTVTTSPAATCLTLVQDPVLNSSGDHLGLPQPPLAIAEILADGSLDVTAITTPGRRNLASDPPRFELPGAGADVSLVRLRALTALDGAITVTISYTDQDGDASTAAQSEWDSPAALATKALSLGSDTGLKAVLETGWLATTDLTEGVFAVEVAELRTPAL